MAGYSGTPLAKKLGFKEGFRASLLSPPEDFADSLEPLPAGVEFVGSRSNSLDLVVLFVDSASDLARTFAATAGRLRPAGMLWIAWPKKSSGVATDVSENVVREIGLAAGLVDVKVCAIDEVWSGLKFVRRLRDR